MRDGGDGPLRECSAGFVRGERFSVGVNLVAVVEDKDGAQLVLVERGDEPVVGGEILFARLAFGAGPREVHAHPLESRGGQHLHLAGLRIGEVDVHPEALRHHRRRQRRMRCGSSLSQSRKGAKEEGKKQGAANADN